MELQLRGAEGRGGARRQNHEGQNHEQKPPGLHGMSLFAAVAFHDSVPLCFCLQVLSKPLGGKFGGGFQKNRLEFMKATIRRVFCTDFTAPFAGPGCAQADFNPALIQCIRFVFQTKFPLVQRSAQLRKSCSFSMPDDLAIQSVNG